MITLRPKFFVRLFDAVSQLANVLLLNVNILNWIRKCQ